MKYEFAPELQTLAEEICLLLFPHIKITKIKCFRSYGSSTKRTIARCHTLGKIMQMAIGVEAYYAIEVLSEKFDKLSEKDKVKTILHELMHIPKAFGGGFRHHDWVTDKNVNKMYKTYVAKKEERKKMSKLF